MKLVLKYMLLKNIIKKINPLTLGIILFLYLFYIGVAKITGRSVFLRVDYFQVYFLLIAEFTVFGFVILFLLPNLVKDLFRQKKNINLLLFLALAVGFILRLVYANSLPFTNDEGAYLYDGLLISQGSSPFYFSFARSPVLVYPLGIIIKIFGNHLLVGRLFNIFVATGIGLLLFRIGTELKNKKSGLLAVSIFSIFPTIVSDTVYLHTQTSEYFLILLGFYLFIKALKKSNDRLLIYSIIPFSLAVLIREVAVFYLPLIFILVFVFYQGDRMFKAKIILKMGLISTSIIVAVWSLIALQVGFDRVYANLFSLATQRASSVPYWEITAQKFNLLTKNLVYFVSILLLIVFSFIHFLRGSKLTSKISLWLYVATLALIISKIPVVIEAGELSEFWPFFVLNLLLFSFSSKIVVFDFKEFAVVID